MQQFSWQEEYKLPKIKKPFFWKEKIISLLLVFSFVIFLSGFAIFILSLSRSSKNIKGLKVEIDGPTKVEVLTPYKYTIKISNDSQKTLTKANLQISLTDGVFFKDKPEEKNIIIDIGEIKPQTTKTQELTLIFFGEENVIESLDAKFNYNIENKQQIFTEKRTLNFNIFKTPLYVKANVPHQVIVGQEFSVSFAINYLSEIPVDLQFELQPPSFFQIKSAEPETVFENIWSFEELKKDDVKDIKISGVLNDIPSVSVFGYRLKLSWKNIEFSLPTKLVRFTAQESPIALKIESKPAKENLNLNSELYYRIYVENKSSMPIKNSVIKAYILGPIRSEFLSTDGYFSLVDNSITWGARTNPELAVLMPKEEVQLKFSFRLKNEFPIFEDQTKNFELKIIVEFSTESIPPGISVEGNIFKLQVIEAKKIIGEIIAESELKYSSEYFPSKGVYPLQSGQETYLTWEISLKTAGEDFKDITLETSLPAGVELMNVVGAEASLENILFDPHTGKFIYQIKELQANYGFVYNDYKLAFLLKVIPPANVGTLSWIIVPEGVLSAKGTFTNETIKKTIPKLTGYDIKQ